ncbi:MAG: glycosyltransferase [Pirellulales bacterium]
MNASPLSPIRIAFCITELDPGGAERCLVELVERLDRRRFQPWVYCLGPRPQGNPSSLADRLERSGAPVHALGARHVWQVPRVARELVARMREDAPQIVQCFLFHANVLGTWAARRAGVQHTLCGIRVAERKSGWHLRVARWADRWAERHVCVSHAVKDFSATVGRLPADKLVEIPNGVDIARFAAARPASWTSLGLPLGRGVITYIGRLDEQKGVHWLLGLMPQIFTALPDYDLVIAGVGPQRKALERRAATLGIQSRVHFAGYRQDVPEILAASELLVLPSFWEGMPNVVLEAMAAGKPVVATDVEGVREVLGSKGAEQVVPIGKQAAFVEAVLRILQHPELADHLGLHNHLRVAQSFSLDSMTAAYERLYRSLAGA